MAFRLIEDTKALKQENDFFHQRPDDQEKKLIYFTTSYYERLQNVISNNRFGNQIDVSTSELESTIAMKFDKIRAENKKIFNSSDMKLSALTSDKSVLVLDKPCSPYEQPSDYIIKLLLLK